MCSAASWILPLTLYLWTAAPAPCWLDSGEFLATGFALGTAHPPGHPVFVTLLKFLMFLPLGPITFRGALISAVPAAIACALTYRINLHLTRKLDGDAPRWIAPLFALFGALLFAVTPALWGEATRPEVYALQLALVLSGLLALVHFGLEDRGKRSARLAIAAGFTFGLSLANHHFLSLLLLPGVIILLTEDALERWERTVKLLFVGIVPAIMAGLIAYAHLPLRARTAPGAVSLGSAPDLPTFFWVVSARAFQRAVTEPPTTSYGERLTEAAFLIATQLGPLAIIAALGGFYFLIRQSWSVGCLLFVSMIATWLARSWMGFDPQNPDVLGYLLVPVCFVTVGVARLGPLLVTIVPARITVRVGLVTVVGLGILGTTAFVLWTSWAECNRSERRGAEIIADEQLSVLPPRTVLITELFSSGFNVWTAQTVEGMRPDVSHFHFPFIGFPSYVQQVHGIHPDLQGVLRAALTRGELDEGEISSLAQRRPIAIEPLMETPEDFQAFLLPRGLTWEAGAEPLASTDVNLAATDHFARWDLVLARLGDDRQDEQTRRVLLWRLYIDSLLFAQRGEREAATQAVERGLIVAPETPELEALGFALEVGRGPLDITPFLPPNARHVEQDVEVRPTRTPVLDF